jgi:hypothetical protein
VGAENARQFTDSSSMEPAGFYMPGVIIWTSGDNASDEKHQIGLHSGSGQFALRTPLRFPIQVGDQYLRREDCTKKVEGDRGCKYFHGPLWVLRFRGEDRMQSGNPAMVPGAEVGPGDGGLNSEPYPGEPA